jgi:hypothetical protein
MKRIVTNYGHHGWLATTKVGRQPCYATFRLNAKSRTCDRYIRMAATPNRVRTLYDISIDFPRFEPLPKPFSPFF